MKTRFAGQIAIVTGGGGAIGRATAMRLAREGATVVVVDCDKDQAEKVAAEITSAGGQAWAIQTDVAERDQVEAMAGAVFARDGRRPGWPSLLPDRVRRRLFERPRPGRRLL